MPETTSGGSATAAPGWAKALPKPLPDSLFAQGYTEALFVVLVYRDATRWWERLHESTDMVRAVEHARSLADQGIPAVVLRQTVTHGTHSFVMSALPEEA